MKKWGMRVWILCYVLVVVGVLWSIFLEMEWRYPSGPQGNVQVHYTIPVTMPNGEEGWDEFSFWIAGHVEKVQLVPTSGHNEHGFVMLYIQTTEGWYETPTASLGGPIDWKRGVMVHFHYPKNMAPREKTRDDIRGFHPLTAGIRWPGFSFGFGAPLLEGDVYSILFRVKDGVDVTVERTTGLRHNGFSGGDKPGIAIEVVVSDK